MAAPAVKPAVVGLQHARIPMKWHPASVFDSPLDRMQRVFPAQNSIFI